MFLKFFTFLVLAKVVTIHLVLIKSGGTAFIPLYSLSLSLIVELEDTHIDNFVCIIQVVLKWLDV